MLANNVKMNRWNSQVLDCFVVLTYHVLHYIMIDHILIHSEDCRFVQSFLNRFHSALELKFIDQSVRYNVTLYKQLRLILY